MTIPFILVFWSICDLHGSDKPGESGKPGDMINILKSQGERGKGREKFQKFFKPWRSQGGFFDKADKPISRLFLLKLKSKIVFYVFCMIDYYLYLTSSLTS